MPLYARRKVLSDCVEAARGEITVADTVHWKGVHGTVGVRGDALFTGQQMRDVIMHQILQTVQFPEIFFTVDSLVNVTEEGDTVRGSAVGTLTIRNTVAPTIAAVTIFPDSNGMRVLAKWHVPAQALYTLTPDLHTVSLGITTKLWKTFFMGADLLFHREPADSN